MAYSWLNYAARLATEYYRAWSDSLNGRFSLTSTGCDILPKAASSRVALSFWFFFALIVISSYTANLAAFLTSSRMGVDIKSAEDLAKQSKIQYGAVAGGSTSQFFKNSNFSTYQRM